MVSDARTGRPTSLTEKVAGVIMGHVHCGAPIVVAARAAGIHRSQFYRWMERGEREPSSIYGEFRDNVEKAEAAAECEAVRSIWNGDEWTRKAWWLERTRPDSYALRKPREVAVQEQGPTIIHVSTGEEKDTLISQLNNRIAALEEAK